MNGLEKIVLTIKQTSDERSAEIIKSAEEKAKAIKADAEKTAAAESDKIIEAANRKSERTLEAAKATSVSNGLKEMLKYKSGVVKEVIETAVKNLDALGDKEYFEVIEKLIYANCHKGESGKILFGERDSKRVPAGFLDKVNATIGKDSGKLSDGGVADIKNGFVLSYGDIEENCSFDAIVSSKEDALKDTVASILFG